MMKKIEYAWDKSVFQKAMKGMKCFSINVLGSNLLHV